MCASWPGVAVARLDRVVQDWVNQTHHSSMAITDSPQHNAQLNDMRTATEPVAPYAAATGALPNEPAHGQQAEPAGSEVLLRR